MLRRGLLALLVVVVGASVIHRLWLQFRPLPITVCRERPMTEAEWRLHVGTNTAMPANISMVDESPFPSPGQPALVSAWDIRKIRALASWGTLMPFRIVHIRVWNSTNVTLQAYERNTSQLAFTKDAAGWHVERIGGQIDWVSEDAKPIFSFH